MRKLLIMLQVGLCLFNTEASVIQLQSTQTTIKPLFTTDMSLRCSLKDSSPSSQVIGKRSVDALSTSRDLPAQEFGDERKQQTVKTVTQTDQNMKFAVSMVISRDGVDLAHINEHIPATAAMGMSGLVVSGQLNKGSNAGELGYLEIKWPHPSLSEAGTYKCEISALSDAGHDVGFAQTLEVNSADVTIEDLVTTIHDLIVDKEQLIIENYNFNKTIADLTQELTSLKAVARKEPDVFFTAGLMSEKVVNIGQTVVYDKIFTNQGLAYDDVTGYFTAPFKGFYKFEFYAAATPLNGQVRLRVNGVDMMDTLLYDGTSGTHYNSAANGLTTKLKKGDKVDVACRRRTCHLDLDVAGVPLNSFSGRLISIL